MKKLLILALLYAPYCMAQDVSPTGTTIEVETYKCKVTSPRSIECQNIGRVCNAYNKLLAERHEKEFGCGLKDNKNYPCKPWEEILERIKKESDLANSCTRMIFGGFL